MKAKNKITAEDFKVMDGRFQRSKEVARALDRGQDIPHSARVSNLSIEDLLDALTPKRHELLRLAILDTKSIAELAEAAHRDASAVSKDIAKLAALGLITIEEVPNSGHGVKKMVKALAKRIEILATI